MLIIDASPCVVWQLLVPGHWVRTRVRYNVLHWHFAVPVTILRQRQCRLSGAGVPWRAGWTGVHVLLLLLVGRQAMCHELPHSVVIVFTCGCGLAVHVRAWVHPKVAAPNRINHCVVGPRDDDSNYKTYKYVRG